MSALCRILMLGRLAVVQGDRTIARFRTRKTAALLAYLAYHRDQSHSREQLVDLFWPEADPNPARRSLSVAVCSLRHQLEPPGVPGGAVLVADRFTLQLRPETVVTDVADFTARLTAASQAESRSERILCLEEAVALYSGEFLPGFHESWASRERVVLAERFIEVTCALTELLASAGEREAAVSHARRAVAVDPLREEPRRELMRLHVALGEPQAALEQYRELEQLMQAVLKESPSAATRELAQDLERLHAGRQPAASPAATAPAPAQEERARRSVPARRAHPTGTVTLLLIGENGASGTSAGESSRSAGDRHKLLQREFQQHVGHELPAANGTTAVLFGSAGDAVACAAACLATTTSPAALAAHMRVAVHTGDVNGSGTAGLAPLLEHATRLLAAAHPGQILCSEATMSLLRHSLNGGLAARDLGAYRLHDLSRTERLFQIDFPEKAVGCFPPPHAEPAVTSRLPLQLTRFFGREKELARVVRLLTPAHGTTRLVTFWGPPGSGKTRLAEECAARLLAPFAGAVWYVPLADLQDSERIAEAILTALEARLQLTRSPLEEAAERLRAQPALLLLDNFEHLPAGATVVASLLAQAPALRLLVTSQQRLGLAGENEFIVNPLPLPETNAVPAELARVPSVQLFVDRARAVLPDFQLTTANAAALTELCRKLDGIPLAIELAASRMQVLSPERLLEQLDRGLAVLASRRRDVEVRHRTLRAALEWSYGLLRTELQRFLSRLAVFRGGWTAAAAAFVCEEALASDYLEELRESSLVVADAGDRETRFRMLEMIREYAAEQLAAEGEEPRIRQRHLEFFLALAEDQLPDESGTQQGEWFAALEADYGNLRHALAWCQQVALTEGGLRLGTALKKFWIARGHWQEGLGYLESMLAATARDERSALRAAALRAAGNLALSLQDCAKAKRLFEESRLATEALGNHLEMASSLRGLARVAHGSGALAEARLLLKQALGVCRDLRALPLEAKCLTDLAIVAACEGDPAEATDLLQSALAIHRESRSHGNVARVLHSLAILNRNAGDHRQALELSEEALGLNRMLGNKRWEAVNLNLIGSLTHHAGDLTRATECYERAAAIQRDMGEPTGGLCARQEPLALGGERREHERALVDENLAALRCGNRNGVACALEILERLCLESCRFDPTRPCFCECMRLMRSLVSDQGDFFSPPIADLPAATIAAAAKAVDQDVCMTQVARLVGATVAVAESERVALPPYARRCLDRTVSALRAALGDAAFDEAASEGRSAVRRESGSPAKSPAAVRTPRNP